jgi:alpha-1,2-mannosyltransferase
MTTVSAQRKSWPRWAAWGVWLLCFTIIMADVVHKPQQHTTTPTYRFATTEWWQGHDPYTFDQHAAFPPASEPTPWWMVHHDEFLYFPQAAFLFTPFNALPFMLGEIFWRATTFGLFAYALVRLNRFFLSTHGASVAKNFLILSLLAIPSSFASLRNAQFDLPLAALIVLTSAEIASARWTAASAWLCVALALKPLAAVPLLLFGALYWKLIPRVIVGLLIVLALPFIHWNPAFVAHEYVRCAQALGWASAGEAPKFSDLSALLSHFGYNAPNSLKTITRVLFALIYLGLGTAALRRLNRIDAAWAVGALSADYLMLFNPRTETCSYVFLGPFAASLALHYTLKSGRKWLSFALGFTALGFACDAIPYIHEMTDRWFKPLLALFFFPVLIQFIFEPRPEIGKRK